MKKVTVSLMGLLCAVLFLGACKDKTPVAKEDCDACKSYANEKPLEPMEINTLLTMTERYKKMMPNQGLVDYQGKQQEDARTVWLELDRLKQFIWEIEHNTCQANCKEQGKLKLGVRIYFGRYPETGQNAQKLNLYADLQGLQEDYEGRHTIFMVPTYENPKVPNEQIDFDPASKFDPATCVFPPIITEGSGGGGLEAKSKKILALTVSATARQYGTAAALNHGNICPPICKPKTGAVFAQ